MHAFKLYNPEDAPQDVDLTLREAFTKYLLRDLKATASRGNLQAYQTALRHWEFHNPQNPPIRVIDNNLIRDFRDALQETGMAAETIKKYWRHLRAIFRRLGPQHEKNPWGESVIDKVPAMRAPADRGEVKMPRIVTFAEIDALFEACSIAFWPSTGKVPAPDLWRAMLVLSYNYGPRTWDTWNLTWDKYSDDLLFLYAAKTSKLQGMPLNRTVKEFLNSIRLPARPNVFHPTKGRKQFYDTWARINEHANLRQPVEFRDLRETAMSKYNGLRPGVGQWILGHAAKGVSDTYYLNPSEDVRDAVTRLPQPPTFEAGPRCGRRQLTMF